MNRLEEIESESRRAIAQAARGVRSSDPVRVFFMTFLSVPFLVVEAMFVPLIGQIFVGGVIIATVTYLWKTRAVKETIAVLSGIIAAIVAFSLVRSPQLIQNQPTIVYSFFGLCTFVTVGILVLVSGALWTYYEKGRKSLVGRSPTDSE